VRRIALTRRIALAAILAALITPSGALAATATVPGTKITVPASALPQGTTSTATGTSSTTTTPANGAQPGTVAPGSSTPTTSTSSTATPTATTPGATTPQSATPTGPTGPAALAPATTGPGTPATLGIARAKKPHQSSKGLSGLALVLAIVGALLILACLIWAAARWMGLQPRWATATMYSLREASYHASATWAEFSDWAKIGH
jgi:hypothetical protein